MDGAGNVSFHSLSVVRAGVPTSRFLPLLFIFGGTNFPSHRFGCGTSCSRNPKQLTLMIAKRFSSHRFVLLIFPITLMVAFASCKKNSETAAPSNRDKINACELITNPEVQA